MSYIAIYADGNRTKYGRKARNGDRVTMKVDTKAGTVSFKIEDTDFGVAYTSQRICSGDYYPAVSGNNCSIVKFISFNEK